MKSTNSETSKIDQLREMIAQIGAIQLEYHRFFPDFAHRLEREFGQFLGAEDMVALCRATGPFNFERGGYHHEGLGFEGGQYRIPLMIRLKNLKDEGETLVRIRLYFSKVRDTLTVQAEGHHKMEFSESGLEPLYTYVYERLRQQLSIKEWFLRNPDDYQGTAIGFV